MISSAQMSTFCERHGIKVLFVFGVAVGFCISLPHEKLFLSATATIGTLLSSLTGVSISILLSLKTDIADALRKKGFYKELMNYAHVSILLALLVTLIAISGFLIPCEYDHVYTPVFSGVFLSSFGAFYRVFWLLLKIGGFYRSPK